MLKLIALALRVNAPCAELRLFFNTSTSVAMVTNVTESSKHPSLNVEVLPKMAAFLFLVQLRAHLPIQMRGVSSRKLLLLAGVEATAHKQSHFTTNGLSYAV